MDRLYTAEASAYGQRTGAVITSDDRLDLQLSRPKDMGGDDGPGTNPEQLFAAGYAACFHSAMRYAVRDVGLASKDLEGSHVTARVHFLKGAPAEFGLAVELELTAPQIDGTNRATRTIPTTTIPPPEAIARVTPAALAIAPALRSPSRGPPVTTTM